MSSAPVRTCTNCHEAGVACTEVAVNMCDRCQKGNYKCSLHCKACFKRRQACVSAIGSDTCIECARTGRPCEPGPTDPDEIQALKAPRGPRLPASVAASSGSSGTPGGPYWTEREDDYFSNVIIPASSHRTGVWVPGSGKSFGDLALQMQQDMMESGGMMRIYTRNSLYQHWYRRYSKEAKERNQGVDEQPSTIATDPKIERTNKSRPLPPPLKPVTSSSTTRRGSQSEPFLLPSRYSTSSRDAVQHPEEEEEEVQFDTWPYTTPRYSPVRQDQSVVSPQLDPSTQPERMITPRVDTDGDEEHQPNAPAHSANIRLVHDTSHEQYNPSERRQTGMYNEAGEYVGNIEYTNLVKARRARGSSSRGRHNNYDTAPMLTTSRGVEEETKAPKRDIVKEESPSKKLKPSDGTYFTKAHVLPNPSSRGSVGAAHHSIASANMPVRPYVSPYPRLREKVDAADFTTTSKSIPTRKGEGEGVLTVDEALHTAAEVILSHYAVQYPQNSSQSSKLSQARAHTSSNEGMPAEARAPSTGPRAATSTIRPVQDGSGRIDAPIRTWYPSKQSSSTSRSGLLPARLITNRPSYEVGSGSSLYSSTKSQKSTTGLPDSRLAPNQPTFDVRSKYPHLLLPNSEKSTPARREWDSDIRQPLQLESMSSPGDRGRRYGKTTPVKRTSSTNLAPMGESESPSFGRGRKAHPPVTLFDESPGKPSRASPPKRIYIDLTNDEPESPSRRGRKTNPPVPLFNDSPSKSSVELASPTKTPARKLSLVDFLIARRNKENTSPAPPPTVAATDIPPISTLDPAAVEGDRENGSGHVNTQQVYLDR